MKRPQDVNVSLEEIEVLIEQFEQDTLSAEGRGVLVQVLRSYAWVLFALRESRITLKRLKALLFGKVPESPESPAGGKSAAAASPDGPVTEASDAETASGSSSAAEESTRRGGHRPGYGCLGADAYAGAERVACRHEELAVGQRCPVCGRGRLYEVPAGVEMRIDGHALLSALRYELQKLRCSACGQVFTAPLPEAAGEAKYSARARAVLAVGRCFPGLPFYRIESYQAMLGVPVPDATQWDQIEKVGDCAYVVFAHMETVAAGGELIYQDDTAVRIVSLIKENLRILAEAEAQGLSQPKERTGMHTTALAVKVGEHSIILYYSGRGHAGENLQALLEKRQAGLDKPLVMSDALSSNEANEAELIRCHCLAHGRRKFSDLEDVFPQECRVVLDVIKQVFDHDEQARNEQMNPEVRLVYHQDHSRPLMEALNKWLHKQFDDRLVEPRSALGKAISYLLGHRETLTRFLSVASAPIDNNLVERALKLFIRQRKNSLFYKTEHSAYIASVLTSLIATCLHAGVNALEYLVALQEHRAEVFAEPSAWLPWTYQASLAPP